MMTKIVTILCEGIWIGTGIAVGLIILLWLFDAQIFIECGPDSFIGG